MDIEETIKEGTLKLYNTDEVFEDIFITDELPSPSQEEKTGQF